MPIEFTQEELRIIIAEKAKNLGIRIGIGAYKTEDLGWVMETATRIVELCKELQK